jgi:hypothetical protein
MVASLFVLAPAFGCAKRGKGGDKEGPAEPRVSIKQLAHARAVLTDPVSRSYQPGFLKAFESVEAADATAAALPSLTPGRYEVVLSSRQKGVEKTYVVTLDTSKQVFSLSMPRDFAMGDREGATKAPVLHATMAEAMGSAGFVSASMLAFKAKQLDDGIYAAAELAADKGAGELPSKKMLLSDIAAALKRLDSPGFRARALGLLGAAAELGGHPIEIKGEAKDISQKVKKSFLANPLRSKPVGFYTWSETFARIFKRDRLLQKKLAPNTAKALARALAKQQDLLSRYRRLLHLPARLTNGFARPSLAELAGSYATGAKPKKIDASSRPSLFPPSRAHETDLIKKMYGSSPIPDDFNLADEMVRRIRAGKLDLKPRPDSGWYDYQTYALEPLVIPEKMAEASHLELGEQYKKELVKLFKSLLALTRETHIKQLEIPKAGTAAPSPGLRLQLKPQLTQEPLATYYLRRALAYRFVRALLEKTLGRPALAKLRRRTASGPINIPLDRELRLAESLFYGAYLSTARELGMTPKNHPDLGMGVRKSLALYQRWDPRKDPDVSRDIRMMVPVYYDVQRRKIKVWAVLGVTTRPLSVYYKKKPKVVQVKDSEGNEIDLSKVDVSHPSAKLTLAYPVMAELYVKEPLDRKEFRELCDKHKTQPAILQALE